MWRRLLTCSTLPRRSERDSYSAHEDDVVQQTADLGARGRSDHLPRERRDEVVNLEPHQGTLGNRGLKTRADAAQTLDLVSMRQQHQTIQRLGHARGSRTEKNLDAASRRDE